MEDLWIRDARIENFLEFLKDHDGVTKDFLEKDFLENIMNEIQTATHVLEDLLNQARTNDSLEKSQDELGIAK